jgi:hypothetical protein
MAYKINRDDEHIVLPDGPASVRDIQKYFKQRGGSEFYELEAAEVIEVWLDEEDLPLITDTDNPDWSKYGWISARMSVSNSGIDDVISIRPLNTNIKEYPYPGEYVIVVNYFGDAYYTQKLNMYNSVNLNSLPGLSKISNPWSGEAYKENLVKIGDSKIRQIDVEEGDIAFNGRFGQSIRFGSNIKNIIKDDKTIDVNTGKEKSPNVIIRAGQSDPISWNLDGFPGRPVKEDINKDGSSLWMTTDQLVPLIHEKSQVTNLDPKFRADSSGKQVVLTSDRLVFNSRKNIFLYSDNDINLVSKNRIVLEGHKNVYLGDAPKQGETIGWESDNSNIQPVLKGDQTMNIIELLINYLIEFSITMQSAKGSVVDFIVPISGIKEGCMGLEGSLRTLKTRLDEPKSNIVKTG